MTLTPEQLAERRTGIGASESAAVVGLSTYRTALDVYLDKTSPAPADDVRDTEAMYWGRELEGVILRRYARDTGRELNTVQRTVRSAEHPFMLATPDAVGPDRLVEVKTAGVRQAEQWGEPGTDAVPMPYLVQVTHQMIVTGHKLTDLAVLIGGNDYRVYSVALDPDLVALLVPRLKAFWAAVEARQPPEPTTLAAAAARWPQDAGTTMVATGEMLDAWAQLKTVRADLKAREADADALELALKTCMADASVLTDAAGKRLCTWTTEHSRRFDASALKAAQPEVYEAHRVESTRRVFRLK